MFKAFLVTAVLAQFLFLTSDAFALRKIQVGPLLTERLETILERSQDLHTGLVEQEPGQVEIQIERVKKAIEAAVEASGEAGSNRPHLMRILERTQRAVEQARAYSDEEKKRKEFKDAFNQIVLLAQAYKLTKSFRIYFCSKDKAVWLQKKGRAKNPINPSKYPKCGTIVRY